MSGHSKWSTIKRQKGAADQKRGALFTKLGNNITIAARDGGDPSANFRLRIAIDQAKAVNMPKDNIERAIKRGTGELRGAALEEIVYEAFGPAGTFFIIESLTDNKNRSVSDIRHIFSKFNCSLGGKNSVMWQFEKKGVIRIMNSELKVANLDEDEFELKLIDAGAYDIQKDDEETIIYTQMENLQKVKENLENKNIKIEYAQIEYIPKELKKIKNEKDGETIKKLYGALDECEDVSDFYTNADVE
ncbi:YebC/PmpR family DNA-binding transcriptional regulator [Candidatus Parcubacteria bacterium]|nr:YebC/PmpR family DNA-binding transcriptional regulator [Candidatus Parcubacteria bacterium]